MGRPPRISREQLLDAARSVFAEKGFSGATLADVARPLGVTPAAILRHFDTKQALFAAAMSSANIGVPSYVEELGRTPGDADPRVVLRHFAEQFIPFVMKVIGPAIAVQMHHNARQTTVVVPFDTNNEESPSRRGLRIVTGYFQRAMDAGVFRRTDPRALALLYISQLHTYVFIHQVLNVTPVYPLDAYLDALIDLWVRGAIQPPKSGGTRARSEKGAPKSRSAGRSVDADRGDAAVHAKAQRAEAARPRRNAGSKDGERGLAGGRPRRPRSR
ncbi:MAG TPA: TetR/AcrR family transcriptional regulator [Thermoanaerobaculia bacterium]|jgi:AcrR family transcriptional regulator